MKEYQYTNENAEETFFVNGETGVILSDFKFETGYDEAFGGKMEFIFKIPEKNEAGEYSLNANGQKIYDEKKSTVEFGEYMEPEDSENKTIHFNNAGFEIFPGTEIIMLSIKILGQFQFMGEIALQ